jgi:hypothetical protein
MASCIEPHPDYVEDAGGGGEDGTASGTGSSGGTDTATGTSGGIDTPGETGDSGGTGSSSGTGSSGGTGSSSGTGSGGEPSSELSTLFDGADEHVDLGQGYGFSKADTWSTFAWIKATRTEVPIVAKTAGAGWDLYMGDSGAIRAMLKSDSANKLYVVTTEGGFDDGKWHHVGFTYDGSVTAAGLTIYVDGTSRELTVKEDALTTGDLDNDTPCAIASDHGAEGTPYAGNIDEVTIHDVELSAAEVSELHNGGIPTYPDTLSSSASLIGWWRMGDGDTCPTITDHSPTGAHGTMENMEAEDFVPDTPP